MAYKLIGSGVVGNDESRHTEAKNKLGMLVRDAEGREFQYVAAEGTIAVGTPVSVTAGFAAAAQSSDAKGFIGVATAAFADEEFGFVATRGRVLALVPSGVALGDTVTAGNGALSATLTSGTKFATVQEAPVLLSGTTQLKYVFIHG